MAFTNAQELDAYIAVLRAAGGELGAVRQRWPHLSKEVWAILEVAALLYRSRVDPPSPTRRHRRHILHRIKEPAPSPDHSHLALLISAPL